jgi:hypothetical protein
MVIWFLYNILKLGTCPTLDPADCIRLLNRVAKALCLGWQAMKACLRVLLAGFLLMPPRFWLRLDSVRCHHPPPLTFHVDGSLLRGGDLFKLPNGWRISRRRVKRRAQQSKTRRKTRTGNNKTLDQAVGCMRLLGRCYKYVIHLWTKPSILFRREYASLNKIAFLPDYPNTLHFSSGQGFENQPIILPSLPHLQNSEYLPA